MTKKPVSVSYLKLKQTESPTIKSMTQSLPSRSNQDEFSKSNAARQSAGTVVHDKNGNGKVAAQWQNTFY